MRNQTEASTTQSKQETMATKRLRQKDRNRLVVIMGCLVVLATAFALMVPAISITKDVADETPGIEVQSTEPEPAVEESATEPEPAAEEPATEPEPAAEEPATEPAAIEPEATEPAATEPAATDTSASNNTASDDIPGVLKDKDANDSSKDAGSSSATVDEIASASASSIGSTDPNSKDPDFPAQSFSADLKDAKGNVVLIVSVEAPEGAFPAGTFMKIDGIAPKKVQSKVQEALEDANGKNVKIKNLTAVDIVFTDPDGKEIEPAKKVEVKITTNDIYAYEDPALVHVLDKNKESSKGKSDDAEVINKVSIVGNDDTMEFETKAFSPYVIVEYETISAGIITADGASYTVNVSYGEDSGIPEGATLKVEEIATYSRAWNSYLDQANEALGRSDGNGVAYARFYDITILNENNEPIQPNGNVQVNIALDDANDLGEEVKALHFNDKTNKVDVLDASLSGDTVSFDAKSFSVYAVIGGNGPEARAAVNFYGIDGNIVATYYVKNSDVLKNDPTLDPEVSYSYIDDIVVDPGVGGAVPAGQVVVGWSMDDRMKSDETYYEDTDTYVGDNYTVTTTPMTVERIREILVDTEFNDGDIINIYPMIFKYYNVTYFGDKATGEIDTHVSLGTDTIYMLINETSASYTVNQPYSADAHQNFKGWKPSDDTSDSITPDETLETQNVYPNGTKATITGNVTLYVEAPRGNWLIYNSNARGATYNAPQFYLADEVTEIAAQATVEEMDRTGYTLEERPNGEPGWYYLKDEYIDDKGNPTDAVPKDEDGYLIISETYFEPFTFGSKLKDNVAIYAKWTPKTRAPYTIIFRTQNLDRSGYDIAGSYVGEGVVGQPIPFTFVNNMDEDYVTGVGEKGGHYTGFCLNHSGTGNLGNLQKTTGYNGGTPIKQTVEVPNIRAEGDSVLTIYFDRIEYEFRFYYYRENNRNQYSYAQNSRNCQNDPQDQWDNVYNVASWSGFGGNTNRPAQTYGDDLSVNVEGYTAHYFVLNAYYGQNIAASWPQYSQLGTVDGNEAVSFVMMNGTGLKKDANENGRGTGTGTDTIKGTIETLDEKILGKTNDADGNFVVIRYNTRNEWRYHILYEQVDGVDYSSYAVHDVEHGGKLYYEDHVYNSRSTNTDVSKQTAPQFTGYEHVWTSDQNGRTGGNNNNNARWDTREGATTYYHTRFYYDRIKYPINFYDGNYVTGNSANGELAFNRSAHPIEEINPETGAYKQKEAVYVAHGASVPDDVKNYKPPIQPGQEGYVFEGWYIDEACTPGAEYNFEGAVPVGGITVYAKWRQIRYRAFLHSNAYIIDDEGNRVYDDSLNWGSPGQAMAFSIPYGGKVSTPEGTRDEYEFLGWFLDEAGTRLFTESTALNEVTVPENPAYNKDTDYTDYLDKHGNVDESLGPPYNSDKDRFWVTRKLDLYGKWRQIIVGAEGISVEYDVGELGNPDTVPTDLLLYKDSAGAIAQPACKPNDEDKYQFLYWVVQKYDSTKGEFVDAVDDSGNPIPCSPGESFTCLLAWAKRAEKPDHTSDNPSYTYTMKLRAEYGLKDIEKPTHIDWYKNYGEGTRQEPIASEQNLQINEPANIFGIDANDIPTRGGYEFLGWARVPTEVSGSTTVGDVTDAKIIDNDLAASYMYLTYHGDVAEPYFTVNVGGDDVKVTQVAADEKLEYHDMYAVWKKLPSLIIKKADNDSHYIDGAYFKVSNIGEGSVEPTAGFATDDTGEPVTDRSGGYKMASGETGMTFGVKNNNGYVITETTPPDGYIVTGAIPNVYVHGKKFYKDDKHTQEYPASQIDDQGNLIITVENTPGQALPITGGIGVLPYTLGGIALVVLAACLYCFGSRRGRERRLRG